MLNPLLHVCIILLFFVLALLGFIDLAAYLPNLEPPGFEALVLALGGSGVLAIIVLALVALVLTVLGQLLPMQLWRAGLRSNYRQAMRRPLAAASTILAALDAAYPKVGLARYCLVRSGGGRGASISRTDLAIASGTADRLRHGRAGNLLMYDAASFLVLHEAMHHNSGDLRWVFLRNALIRALAAVTGILTAVMFNPDNGDLAPFTILVTYIIMANLMLFSIRQLSREIEKDMDGAALAAIRGAHGETTDPRLPYVIATELMRFPVRSTSILPGSGTHPTRRARVAALLGSRHFGGLAVLWGIALAALVTVQTLRIDPDCNDCVARAQLLYSIGALLAIVLLTILVIGVERRRSATFPTSRRNRFLGLGLVLLSFVLTRLVAINFNLADWIASSGPILGIFRAIFASSDLYTWLVTMHFLVVGIFFGLWPAGRSGEQLTALSMPAVARDRVSLTWPILLRLFARFWQGLDLSLGAFCMALAVLLVLNISFRQTTEQSLPSVMISITIGAVLLWQGSWPSKALILIEGFILGLLLPIILLVLVAARVYATVHGIVFHIPTGMVQMGQLLMLAPVLLQGNELSLIRPLLPADALVVLIVVVLTWLRWWGDTLEKADGGPNAVFGF